MEEHTTIIFSALVGALVAYIGAVLKNIIDTRSKLDDTLFKLRNETYSKLWEETKLVPMWPKRDDIKYSDIKVYSNKLNTWYYEIGGIYMSRKAQKAYVDLQRKIWSILEPEEPQQKLDEQQIIDKKTYKAIHLSGSALRTELTNDLLSRRAPPRV